MFLDFKLSRKRCSIPSVVLMSPLFHEVMMLKQGTQNVFTTLSLFKCYVCISLTSSLLEIVLYVFYSLSE